MWRRNFPQFSKRMSAENSKMLLLLWLFTQMSKTMFYRSTSDAEPVSVSHLARKKADVPAALAYCNEQWKE